MRYNAVIDRFDKARGRYNGNTRDIDVVALSTGAITENDTKNDDHDEGYQHAATDFQDIFRKFAACLLDDLFFLGEFLFLLEWANRALRRWHLLRGSLLWLLG